MSQPADAPAGLVGLRWMTGRLPLLESSRCPYTVMRGTLKRSAICWTGEVAGVVELLCKGGLGSGQSWYRKPL
jgi:hypothetical protein